MNNLLHRLPSHPAIDTLVLLLQVRMDKLREDEDGGYTAVEWVIISAIVIAIVVGVSVILRMALTNKATTVGNCITGANSTNNGGCN